MRKTVYFAVFVLTGSLSSTAPAVTHVVISNIIFQALVEPEGCLLQKDDWFAGFEMVEEHALVLAHLWENMGEPADTRAAKLERMDSRYRTERCSNWRYKGGCPYKNRCRHAHQLYQLRAEASQSNTEVELK